MSNLPIRWLNNDVVFFEGYDQGRREPSSAPVTRGMYSFHTWDTRTNRLTRVHRIMTHPLCASDGRVLYFSPDPRLEHADWVLFGGEWGRERATTITRAAVNSGRATVNQASCTASEAPPQWRGLDAQGNDVRFLGAIKPLKEEHGFLRNVPGGGISGEKRSEFEIWLYRPGAPGPKLVLRHDDTRAVATALRVSLVPFLGKYLLQGSASRLNSEITPAWLMTAEGEVESVAPSKSPTPGIDDYYPTKRGMLFPYASVTNHIDTSKIGAWLITKESIDRIVVGVVRNIAVSPDGCRVAFSHAIHWKAYYDGLDSLRKGGPGYTTLKTIDLCAARGKG